MQIKENRHITWTTAVLMVLLAVALWSGYPRLYAHVYFDLSDEPYQIMCGWNYKASVVAPLSAWFTSVVGPLVNFDLLPLRTIGWTITLLSILIGVLPAWWLTRNVDFSLFCAIISTALASQCRMLEWIYGWDPLAALPTMITAVAAFRFVFKPGYKPLVWSAIALGVATMMRLPSVAIGVAPIFAIITTAHHGKKFGYLAAFIGIASVTALSILIALYGSVGSYLDFCATNIINEHSPLHMFSEYFLHLSAMPFYFLLFSGTVFAAERVLLPRHMVWNICIGVCLVAGLSLSIYYWTHCTERGLTPVNIVILAALLYSSWFCHKSSKRHLLIFGIISLITMMSAAAGSNMVIYKCLTYQVLPMALALVTMVAPSWRTIAGWGLVLTAAVVFAAMRDYDVIRPNNGRFPSYYPPKTTVDGMRHHDGLELDFYWTDLLQNVVDKFGPYANSPEYSIAVVRNVPRNFIYEYMFDARNPVAPHYWAMDKLMDKPGYCRKIEHMVDTMKAPAAVLLLQNISCRFDEEPELISRMKERYRTVYSDTSFTIVIKDANQGK